MHNLDHIYILVFRFLWQRVAFFALSVFLLIISPFIFSQSQVINPQSNKFRIVHWDSKDGLSLGYKNHFLKDVNGFLWVSSPVGLNKFDGNTFKVYYPGKTESGTILGSYCLSMVEDSIHNIWIGTNKGLVHYNTMLDSFNSIPATVTAYSDLTTIIPFWSSRDNLFCIESANYLTKYDLHTKQRKVLATLPSRQTWKNQVIMAFSVFDSASNSVWMLSGENQETGNGLIRVSPTDKTIRDYSW
ncbi:MAG: hypothetical protein ACRC2O_05985, partial [Chitinophagaceae bacterium]